ncbi:MAG: phytanoyl-CoA dioxygenase family protein [Pseudomonadota bacterium]
MNRHRFSQSELEQYQSLGFCVRSAAFGVEEIDRLQTVVHEVVEQACLAALQGENYHLDGKRFCDTKHYTVQFEFGQNLTEPRVIEPIYDAHPLFASLVDDPRFTDPIRSILHQDQLALWTAKLNLKCAGGNGFGWHQDSPYWIHDSNHVDLLPNVMLLLGDQSELNGCFKLIPGSHHQGVLPGTTDGSQLGGFYTDPDTFDESTVYHCEHQAGSLVFFNPHIIHGSGPNTSDAARPALIYTYQPAGYPTLKTKTLREVAG